MNWKRLGLFIYLFIYIIIIIIIIIIITTIIIIIFGVMLVEPVVNSFFIYKTMKQCEIVQKF